MAKKSKKVEEIKVVDPEVVTSEKIGKKRDVSLNALEEITLLKDHGEHKKGEKLMRHPNTADVLRRLKIAK